MTDGTFTGFFPTAATAARVQSICYTQLQRAHLCVFLRLARPALAAAHAAAVKRGIQGGFWYAAARVAGRLRPQARRAIAGPVDARPSGVSVVIPSRNGKHLLSAQLPGIAREAPAEIMVVDNGSDDGTAGWLRAEWPQVRVEVSATPLSFARAVNRGIAGARYSHVCLLNNDMLIEPGFFQALAGAFCLVPDLFCATAQIRFPEGVRREETGKAVMAQDRPEDFPIRCDEPVPGEDLSYVLYGSGGCSLYDGARLRALGNVDEAYEPAYVEDLDLGYRAWQRGWPTVYVAGAVAEHRHRATTLRYYTDEQLTRILEINYLKFLARAVAGPRVFRRLWRQALDRAPESALRAAAGIALRGGRTAGAEIPEEEFLALTNGAVAVFPGRANAADAPVLVAFAERLEQPPADTLAAHREVVLVRRGAADSFRAALRQTQRKWPKSRVIAAGYQSPSPPPRAPAS